MAEPVLSRLLEIAVALSAQRDRSQLLNLIVQGALDLGQADGGTLYLVHGDMLHFEIVLNRTLKMEAAKLPDIPKNNEKTVVAYAVVHRKTVNIHDAYTEKGFDLSGTREFDAKSGYHSKSFLTVPLINHEDDVIGVLQLINAKEGTFSVEAQQLVEALASLAAVALTNQQLIAGLKEMFESLTRVIAEAIDEKSPVTGRHCKRVPIIARMLAESAREKYHITEDELYELDIAALLHDCGKVTTPVYVVEKGKKLQTIIDRLTLVKAHLEIVYRDRLLKGQDARQELLQEYAFIKETNEGKETMSEEDLAHVDRLAQITWTDMEGQRQFLLTDDEVLNLKIIKGTLTDDERQIIQNHAAMTIRMLSKIPYPKYLRNVTEIAGSHHERIDGKGYPRGLTGEQMSPRAKILAIADIFEALTAPDRPYKKPMPLSQALSIMDNMCVEGHIDKDLWQQFKDKKVWLAYGKQHLDPSQLDLS